MTSKPVKQTFSYTARRGPFLMIVFTFGTLLCVESGSFLPLILALIPNFFVKWSLAIILLLFILFLLFGVLLSASRTKHSLTRDDLYIHYGHLLNITLPRAAIKNAQGIHEPISLIGPILARYDAQKQRITACFSEQGQILLTLTEPLALKLGRQEKMVRTLLINADQHEELLAALRSEGNLAQAEEEKQQDSRLQQLTQRLASAIPSKRNDAAPIAIHINGLSRSFKQFLALDQLDMQIRVGEIYGLLGSNGAGKTTTIKMLVGLLTPGTGSIEIGGYDLWEKPEEVKRILGYVPDRSLLYERLSGREYLEFLAQIRGLEQHKARERIEALLDLLELKEQAGRLCGSYSFGMKRKLSLAGALLHQPKILILDEALNGLDPRSARRVKDLLLELASNGITILLSTHDLATAEEVCNRVGILHKGHLLAEGSVAELRQQATATDLEEVFLNLTMEQATEALL